MPKFLPSLIIILLACVFLVLPVQILHAQTSCDNLSACITETYSWATETVRLSPYTISEFLTNIIVFVSSFVAIVTAVVILFGGLMYVFSAGDERRAAQAKNIILFAIIGLIIAVNTSIIVGLIQDVAGDPAGPGLGVGPIIELIGQIGIIILAPLALIATGAIVYGGYMYITSAGEEDRARRGKQIIIYALVGVFITLISALIVNVVISL